MKMYSKALKEETTVWALYDNETFGTTYKNWAAEYPVGWNTPSPNSYPGHKGVDMGNYRGQNVYAITSGIIKEISHQDNDARGKYVIMEVPGIASLRYLHLDSVAVAVGQSISEGAIVGKLGNTGASQGPHVHVDVWMAAANNFVDPFPYLTGEWAFEQPIPNQEVDNVGYIPPTDGTGYNPIAEWGRFTNTSGTYINARVEPNINKPTNANYRLENGQAFEYDKYVVYGDHTWLRNTANNFWYAWRVRGGEKFGYIE